MREMEQARFRIAIAFLQVLDEVTDSRVHVAALSVRNILPPVLTSVLANTVLAHVDYILERSKR